MNNPLNIAIGCGKLVKKSEKCVKNCVKVVQKSVKNYVKTMWILPVQKSKWWNSKSQFSLLVVVKASFSLVLQNSINKVLRQLK